MIMEADDVKDEPGGHDPQVPAVNNMEQIVKELTDGPGTQQLSQQSGVNNAVEVADTAADDVDDALSEENVSFVPVSEQEDLNRAFKETFLQSEATQQTQGPKKKTILYVVPSKQGGPPVIYYTVKPSDSDHTGSVQQSKSNESAEECGPATKKRLQVTYANAMAGPSTAVLQGWTPGHEEVPPAKRARLDSGDESDKVLGSNDKCEGSKVLQLHLTQKHSEAADSDSKSSTNLNTNPVVASVNSSLSDPLHQPAVASSHATVLLNPKGAKDVSDTDETDLTGEDLDLWSALKRVVKGELQDPQDDDGIPVANKKCISALSSLMMTRLAGKRTYKTLKTLLHGNTDSVSFTNMECMEKTASKKACKKTNSRSVLKKSCNKEMLDTAGKKSQHGLSDGLLYESCLCESLTDKDKEEQDLWRSVWVGGQLVHKLPHLGIIRVMGTSVFTFDRQGLLFMNVGELFWRGLLPRHLSEFQTIVEFFDEIPDSVPQSEIAHSVTSEAEFTRQFTGSSFLSYTLITPFALRAIYERLGELHGVEKWQRYAQTLFYKQQLGHQCTWTILVTPPSDERSPECVPGAVPNTGQVAVKRLYTWDSSTGEGTSNLKNSRESLDGGAGTPLKMKDIPPWLNKALISMIETWEVEDIVEPFCSCVLHAHNRQSFQPLTFDGVSMPHITEMKFMDLDSLHCWKRNNGFFVSFLELQIWGMLPATGSAHTDELIAIAFREATKGDICYMYKAEVIFLSIYGYVPEEVLEEKQEESDIENLDSSIEKPGTVKNEKTLLLNLVFLRKIYQMLSRIEGTYVPHSGGTFYIKQWLHDCPKERAVLDDLDKQQEKHGSGGVKVQRKAISNQQKKKHKKCISGTVKVQRQVNSNKQENQEKRDSDRVSVQEAMVLSNQEKQQENYDIGGVKVKQEVLDEDVDDLPIMFSTDHVTESSQDRSDADEDQKLEESDSEISDINIKTEIMDDDTLSAESMEAEEDAKDDLGEKDIVFNLQSYPVSCHCLQNKRTFYPLKVYSILQCFGTKYTKRVVDPLAVLPHVGQAIVNGHILFTFKTNKMLFFSVAELMMQNLLQGQKAPMKKLRTQGHKIWRRTCSPMEDKFLTHQGIKHTNTVLSQMMISAEFLCFLSYSNFVTFRAGLKQSDIYLHRIGHICPYPDTIAHKSMNTSNSPEHVMQAWTKCCNLINSAESIMRQKITAAMRRKKISDLKVYPHDEVPTPPIFPEEEDTTEMAKAKNCHLKLKPCTQKDILGDQPQPRKVTTVLETEYYICTPCAEGTDQSIINKVWSEKKVDQKGEEEELEDKSTVFFGAMVPKNVDLSKADLRGYAYITENQVRSTIRQRFPDHTIVMVGQLSVWERNFCLLQVKGKLYLSWGECANKLIGVHMIYSLAQELRVFLYKVPVEVLAHLSMNYPSSTFDHLSQSPWICVNSLLAVYCRAVMEPQSMAMYPKTFALLWQVFEETAKKNFRFRSFVLIP